VIADIILIIAGALFVGVYVSWRAGRIDRLHARVDMARVALDVALLRRSSVAQELATSGLLDPATSLLLAEAVHGTRVNHPGGSGPAATGGQASRAATGGHASRAVTGGQASRAATGGQASRVVPPRQQSGERPRDLAESDLTRALRAAFSQPDFRASLSGKEGADELLAEVEEAAHQVYLARKFYNDLVAVTRDARRRPLARLLRLSGRAPAPVFFEMDDSLIAEKAGAPLGSTTS
jgi:hypothetical protein